MKPKPEDFITIPPFDTAKSLLSLLLVGEAGTAAQRAAVIRILKQIEKSLVFRQNIQANLKGYFERNLVDPEIPRNTLSGDIQLSRYRVDDMLSNRKKVIVTDPIADDFKLPPVPQPGQAQGMSEPAANEPKPENQTNEPAVPQSPLGGLTLDDIRRAADIMRQNRADWVGEAFPNPPANTNLPFTQPIQPDNTI